MVMEPVIAGVQPTDKPPARPVMDIKTPPHSSSMEPVKAPPPQPGDPMPESVEIKKPQQSKPAKPPRPRGSGVGLAILATIIITLGLGILFVYAYLGTTH